ncbi:MAG: WD domain, G-beta repeat [Candidatus Dependentiae bacterium ADurb.Bin331]|nr:MAG: WD domain, G-beta repeat [Candidatus Dependentiae bacterium ADurb.Bin331]
MKKVLSFIVVAMSFHILQTMETSLSADELKRKQERVIEGRKKLRELQKQKMTPQNYEIVIVLNDGSLPITAEELLFLGEYSQTIKNMSEDIGSFSQMTLPNLSVTQLKLLLQLLHEFHALDGKFESISNVNKKSAIIRIQVGNKNQLKTFIESQGLEGMIKLLHAVDYLDIPLADIIADSIADLLKNKKKLDETINNLGKDELINSLIEDPQLNHLIAKQIIMQDHNIAQSLLLDKSDIVTRKEYVLGYNVLVANDELLQFYAFRGSHSEVTDTFIDKPGLKASIIDLNPALIPVDGRFDQIQKQLAILYNTINDSSSAISLYDLSVLTTTPPPQVISNESFKYEIDDAQIKSISFNAERNEIVFNQVNKNSDMTPKSSLSLIDLKTGNVVELMSQKSNNTAENKDTFDGISKSVSFSPDGNFIVHVTSENLILYSFQRREVITRIKGNITAFAFSPNGKEFAYGLNNGEIFLCKEFPNLAQVVKLPFAQTARYKRNAAIDTLSFDSEGKYLVSGSHDGNITVWQLEEEKIVLSFLADKAPINIVQMIPARFTLRSGIFFLMRDKQLLQRLDFYGFMKKYDAFIKQITLPQALILRKMNQSPNQLFKIGQNEAIINAFHDFDDSLKEILRAKYKIDETDPRFTSVVEKMQQLIKKSKTTKQKDEKLSEPTVNQESLD